MKVISWIFRFLLMWTVWNFCSSSYFLEVRNKNSITSRWNRPLLNNAPVLCRMNYVLFVPKTFPQLGKWKSRSYCRKAGGRPRRLFENGFVREDPVNQAKFSVAYIIWAAGKIFLSFWKDSWSKHEARHRISSRSWNRSYSNLRRHNAFPKAKLSFQTWQDARMRTNQKDQHQLWWHRRLGLWAKSSF